MNTEDALRIIKKSPECLVTLRADTGEILTVKNLSATASADDRMACLFNADGIGQAGVPTVSRFLGSLPVNAASLHDLVEETRRAYESMTARVKILNGWRYQSLSDLVAILESGDFPYPTTLNDRYLLFELIFDVRDTELDSALIRRLWTVADSYQVEIPEEPPAGALRLSLWRYEMRTTEFVSYWHKYLNGSLVPFLIGPCVFAGDLKVTDPIVVNDLIRLVRAQWPFGVKQRAMIALGKIGPKAGPEATRAIRDEVYDSTDLIIVQRNRVLARIETDPELWHDCNQCRSGKVIDDSSHVLVLRDCPGCYGLGLISSSC